MPDFINFAVLIFLLASFISLIEEDMDILTSITAPKAPMSTVAKKIFLKFNGLFKLEYKSVWASSELIAFTLHKLPTKTAISSAIITPPVVPNIADMVFRFIPLTITKVIVVIHIHTKIETINGLYPFKIYLKNTFTIKNTVIPKVNKDFIPFHLPIKIIIIQKLIKKIFQIFISCELVNAYR